MTATYNVWDHLAEQLEGPKKKYATPGELAQALDPKTIQTPALDLIDSKLVQVQTGEIDRLMLSMPPQEGKSQRTSRRFPLWLLQMNPDLRIAIVSYAHGIARRWGRVIRDDIREHPELGLVVDPASSAQHEWNLLGHEGSVYCVGIKGSLTSRPVDVLIIDDPYKDAEQADSEAWQETVAEFWTEVAIPRLAPGAPVVIIQTRWRQNDLSGTLQAGDDAGEWSVLNIPAQADHDPNKGETDPLGREPGEFMQSARTNKRTGLPRSRAEWEKRKREVGARAWNALYQGRPAPAEGDLFKRDRWSQYTQPLWLTYDDGTRHVTNFDQLLISWDMAFKDTKSSDYVVGQVWMRRGADIYLLDQIRGRMDFVTTCDKFRELAARWPQALLKLVEDKANGTAVMNSLRRIVQGIVPEEPHGSKLARATAVSPLQEAGNVWLPSPELAPWVGDFIEECAAFPNGAHDDQVDTFSQAGNRLILAPLLEQRAHEEPEEFEELDALGWTVSPH